MVNIEQDGGVHFCRKLPLWHGKTENESREVWGVIRLHSGLLVIRPESIPSAEITAERLFTAHCYASYNQFNQPQFVLVNNNFEFPDLLGAAYEYLIKFFADSAGK